MVLPDLGQECIIFSRPALRTWGNLGGLDGRSLSRSLDSSGIPERGPLGKELCGPGG